MKKRLNAFKQRLTSVSKEEPLNKLSLVTIIILDIIILNILFVGLQEHTNQLTTANEYMPGIAREIFIGQNWTSGNRISKLQPLILADRNNSRYRYESPFEEKKLKVMHPEAQRFFTQAKARSEDKELLSLFLSRQKAGEERKKTESAFNKAKQSYDTKLLENIANATKPGSNSTSTTAKQYAGKIDRLTGEIRSLERQIHALAGIQDLWKIISPDDTERDQIVADYKQFQFWFPLKELFWQLLFMVPIFAIFYGWNRRSIKKDNPIQTLISSHLLVVASLPIILKVVQLVIDIIPKHFFKKLFDLLESWGLLALWYYFAIIVIIIVGLLLVYFIQRKVFNKQKVMQKRVSKGACIRCNKRLPPSAAHCPFCGTGQQTTCSVCGKETPTGGPCCIHCGAGKKD